jgi:hypothetical protein
MFAQCSMAVGWYGSTFDGRLFFQCVFCNLHQQFVPTRRNGPTPVSILCMSNIIGVALRLVCALGTANNLAVPSSWSERRARHFYTQHLTSLLLREDRLRRKIAADYLRRSVARDARALTCI